MSKFWTPHDFDAAIDPGICKLRGKYRMEGYGAYWIMIEQLGMESTHRLGLDKDSVAGLAVAMQMPEEQARFLITFCIDKCNLFETDGKHFWSERLLREMDKYDEISRKKAEAGRKGGLAKASNAKESAKQNPSKCLANTTQHTTPQHKTKQETKEAYAKESLPSILRGNA